MYITWINKEKKITPLKRCPYKLPWEDIHTNYHGKMSIQTTMGRCPYR
jgi:hypothetical protein